MGIIACKNTTITGALTQSWRYDYTYYYSWLKQHEEILCDYQSDDGYYLLLTSKHLQICSRTLKRSFPLQKVNSINLQFKRLMLPLYHRRHYRTLFCAGYLSRSSYLLDWSRANFKWLSAGVLWLARKLAN